MVSQSPAEPSAVGLDTGTSPLDGNCMDPEKLCQDSKFWQTADFRRKIDPANRYNQTIFSVWIANIILYGEDSFSSTFFFFSFLIYLLSFHIFFCHEMVLQTLVSIIHSVCNLRQFKLLIEDESNSVSQPKTQQHRETKDWRWSI